MRRLFFSPAFPCRECEGDVTLLLFFDRGVIMWGLGCVTCAGYSGQAKVFGQTNHTQGLNPRPQCTRPTWLDLPLHILCCVQAYCSVKFTGKTSCIRNYVEFYCIWKQVSVSFFLSSCHSLWRGRHFGSGALTAQLVSFEPQWSLVLWNKHWQSLATTKPVWQVGNWYTGHTRLCEQRNERLREWWMLEVGGVR